MSAFSKSASAVTLGPKSLSKAADEPKQSHSSQLYYVNYKKKRRKKTEIKDGFYRIMLWNVCLFLDVL